MSRVKYLNESSLISGLIFLVMGLLIFHPDITLAATLEDQLDQVGTLATGKFKTIGLSAATIGGAILSVLKGNIKLTGIIVAIGVVLGLYLEWIESGMRLLN